MNSKTIIFLILAIAIGTALRMFQLNVGINLDDAISLYCARADNLIDVAERAKNAEFGPPLYFFFMHYWIKYFGESAASMATPSMIFGALVIPLTFILSQELLKEDKRSYFVSIAAVFLSALSPIAALYSHEARSYTMLTMLAIITLWLYWKQNEKPTILKGILLTISANLMMYCHYCGVYFAFLMVLCYGIAHVKKIKADFKNYLISLSSLFAAGLLFVPWLPTLFQHLKHGTYWTDPTTFEKFPEVLVSNIGAVLPMAWIHAFLFLVLGGALGFFWLLFKLCRSTGRTQLKEGFVKLYRNPLFTIVLMLLFAVGTIGFLTPHIIGYSRYMMIFAPLAWIINGSIFYSLFISSFRFKKIALPILLLLLFLSSAQQIISLGDIDKSGFRAIARDIKEGKYNKSAFLLAPDFNSYTFLYYLKQEQGLSIPDGYFTYPRKRELHSSEHRGYAAAWRDLKRQEELLEDIKRLDTEKFKHLLLIIDYSVIEAKKMPAQTRVKELLAKLRREFKEDAKERKYKGKGKSLTVYRFALDQKPQITKEADGNQD